MKRRLVIKNGTILKSDRLQKTSLLLEDGVIAEDDFRGEEPEDALILDASGMIVAPGFIEIHAHGGGGYDYMDATEEAFEEIARTHLKAGTTSIMPTAVSCSREAMSRLFALYRKVKDSENSQINYLGLHLEGPYISQEMRGAQNPNFVHSPTREEIDSLLAEAGDVIGMCTAAPEIENMDYLSERMQRSGIVLSAGHSDAVCADIVKGYEMGFRHITHLYSNTPTVRKINQVVYAGMREAAWLLDDMRIELIGDGHHVPREVLQLALKIKGADRINLTSDAMRAAGTQVSESYLGEKLPENRVIIEDGVAKLPDRSFYAGSIATGEEIFRWAVRDCGVSLIDASKMMSLTPAKIIGCADRKGSIRTGKDADLIFLDNQLKVRKVIVGGNEIEL